MRKLLIVVFAVLALFMLRRILRFVGQYVGAARTKHVALGAGNIPVPQERTASWKDQSALTEEILQHWATQELPDWQEEGKVKAPKDKWVIISAGGQAVPRTHERWHLMDGKI